MAVLLCAMAIALCGSSTAADLNSDTARAILALERGAMDGWLKGDPDPFLAISDPEITYFHVMTTQRLDGLPAVKALYEAYRGRPLFDSYEIVDPMVQTGGEVAVLTYILVQRNGEAANRYNATEVYQRKKDGWRVVHSHWSATRPSGNR
jgi:ketosteroid isomerase-like protein